MGRYLIFAAHHAKQFMKKIPANINDKKQVNQFLFY
jgi:hypothetical protein